MKTIMIAAAIVCVASFANAASVFWGMDWAYAIDQNHTTYADETAMSGSYLILLGDTVANVTADATGKFTYDTAAFTQVASGTFSDNSTAGTIDGLDVSNNGKYLTMIIFESEYKNADGNSMYGVASAELSGAVASPPSDFSNVTFSNDADGYFVANTAAATAAVPEPTSGLLLLLGIAGLALRRKQA